MPSAKADGAKNTNPTMQPKFRVTYTKQEYKDAVRAAYNLGIHDGEQRRQKTVAAMQAANKHLIGELVRLDNDVPLDSMAITVRLAESIYGYLKQVPNARYCAGQLRERMKMVGGDIEVLMKHCKELTDDRHP